MMRSTFPLLCVLLAAKLSSLAGEQVGDQLRWDERMIQEAAVWKALVKDYAYADKAKYWPGRKTELQGVLTRFKASQWADDAALVIAGGVAAFDKDYDSALSQLDQVVNEYPDAGTVVVGWSPEFGCLYDQEWLSNQGGLVFLNPDGSVRASKPFDNDGIIEPLEREVLAYFAHLDKYPRRTKDVARLCRASILAHRGRFGCCH